MKFVPTNRSRRENLTVFPLLIFMSIPFVVVCLTLARRAPHLLLDWAYCPLRSGTGLPCPSCGSTLAVTRLADGQWLAGIVANPLLALSAMAYVIIAVGTILVTLKPQWQRALILTATEKKAAKWTAASLILVNWFWLILKVYA